MRPSICKSRVGLYKDGKLWRIGSEQELGQDSSFRQGLQRVSQNSVIVFVFEQRSWEGSFTSWKVVSWGWHQIFYGDYLDDLLPVPTWSLIIWLSGMQEEKYLRRQTHLCSCLEWVVSELGGLCHFLFPLVMLECCLLQTVTYLEMAGVLNILTIVMGTELRISCMLRKCPTIGCHLQPLYVHFKSIVGSTNCPVP